MLEKLFGNPVIEKVLFFLLMNEEGYPSLLQKVFNMPLYSLQRAFARLEAGGVLVAQSKGKTRVYSFNPRYPMLSELKLFLSKAYKFLPEELKGQFYEIPARKRPRRTGKPVERVSDD